MEYHRVSAILRYFASIPYSQPGWSLTVCNRTVLSSSGNDGKIRLWKQTVGGVWRPAGQISVEQEEERPDVDMDEGGGR